MRAREFGDAHSSTGLVVMFRYLMPCPMPHTKQKPRNSTSHGLLAQYVPHTVKKRSSTVSVRAPSFSK